MRVQHNHQTLLLCLFAFCFLDVEELRFLKGTTATFDCPLTLQSGNGKGKDNFSQESENDPAYLMKALKVVFFYKGTDSPSPLASYDNRDIEEIRKGNLLSSEQLKKNIV